MTDERTAQFVYQRIQTGAACCYCCDVPILTGADAMRSALCCRKTSVCLSVRSFATVQSVSKRRNVSSKFSTAPLFLFCRSKMPSRISDRNGIIPSGSTAMDKSNVMEQILRSNGKGLKIKGQCKIVFRAYLRQK